MADLSNFSRDEVARMWRHLDDAIGGAELKLPGAAASHLQAKFGLDKNLARLLGVLWIDGYDPDVSAERRAELTWMFHGGKT